jgi:hypothetical protein
MKVLNVTNLTEFFPKCDMTTETENFYIKVGNKYVLAHNSPAITIGTNFDGIKGSFVSTKSIFNANPKVYQTEEDINSDNRPDGLKQKLRTVLDLVKSPGFKVPHNQIWQGDLLWTKGDVKKYEEDGEKYVYVKPNTLMYAAPENSDIGQSMLNGGLGVVFHTRYTSPNGNLNNIKQSNDIDVSELQGIPEWAFVIDAQLRNGSGQVSWTREETEIIKDMYANLEDLCKQLEGNSSYKQLCNNEEFIQFYIMTLQNSKVDHQENIDPKTFISELHDWIKGKSRKQYLGLDKLKTKTGRDKKRIVIGDSSKDLHNIVVNHEDIIKLIAEALSLASELKIEIMEKMNQASHFLTMVEKRDGTFQKTAGEGFVVSDVDGYFVKLVDRKAFSYFNRSPDIVKGFEHPEVKLTEAQGEENIEGEDYIILAFESQEEADEAVKEINNESKSLGLLTESKLYEKDTIAQKQVGDWKFNTKRDAQAFLDELESKYSGSSYNATLSGSSPKFYVQVKKIDRENGKTEIKAETKKAAEVKKPTKSQQSTESNDLDSKKNYTDKRETLIDLFTIVYSAMPEELKKNIGFSESSKGNTAASSITMNVFKVEDIDSTGRANPASDAEIKELERKINSPKKIPGSSESTFGMKFKVLLDNKERDFKIYFRETGGKGPCRPYYFRNGKVLLAEPSSFATYTDTQKTQLSEAITAYFLSKTMNNEGNVEQEIDKVFSSFELFTQFLNKIEFDKQKIFENTNIEEVLQIGFSSFKSSWLNSIKVISNKTTLSEIKNCFADKTNFKGKYIAVHPSLKLKNSDLLFNRLREINFGGAVDSINPSDIYLVREDAVKDILNLRHDDAKNYILSHNSLLHSKKIINLSLKQLAKGCNLAKVSTSHNSTSKEMDSKKGVFLRLDTFEKFILEKPGLLDETSSKEGVSCIIHCYGKGNNIKDHLHLEVRNNEIILDIRKSSNQKDILGTPSIEAGASGLSARLGKGGSAVTKLIPLFNKQFKDELLEILNLKKFNSIMNKVSQLRESQKDYEKLVDMFESDDLNYIDFKKAHREELLKNFGTLNYVDSLFKQYNIIKQNEFNKIKNLIDTEPSLQGRFDYLNAIRNFVYGYIIVSNFKENRMQKFTKLLALTMKYKVLGIDPNDLVNQTVDYIKVY